MRSLYWLDGYNWFVEFSFHGFSLCSLINFVHLLSSCCFLHRMPWFYFGRVRVAERVQTFSQIFLWKCCSDPYLFLRAYLSCLHFISPCFKLTFFLFLCLSVCLPFFHHKLSSSMNSPWLAFNPPRKMNLCSAGPTAFGTQRGLSSPRCLGWS